MHRRTQSFNQVRLLCDPIDYSGLQGSSVHGTSQARMLEWVAISYSRGSSQPRDQTCISYVACPLSHWESTGCLKSNPVFCYKEQVSKIHISQYTFSGGIFFKKWIYNTKWPNIWISLIFKNLFLTLILQELCSEMSSCKKSP